MSMKCDRCAGTGNLGGGKSCAKCDGTGQILGAPDGTAEVAAPAPKPAAEPTRGRRSRGSRAN